MKTEKKCSFTEAKQWVASCTPKDGISFAQVIRGSSVASSVSPSSATLSLEEKLEDFIKVMTGRVQAFENLVRSLLEKRAASAEVTSI